MYIVQAGEDGPVKIGWATVVPRRLAQLQAASPAELVVRRVLAGAPTLEAELHTAFAANRLHGEWFAPGVLLDLDAVLSTLNSATRRLSGAAAWRVPPPPRPRGCPHLAGAVRQLRESAGLTVDDIAERARLSARTVRAIEGAHRPATLDVLRQLAAGLGVTADVLVAAAEPLRESEQHPFG